MSDEKEITFNNALTMKMSAKNSTKVGLLSVDLTGSIGNTYYLGFKTTSNLLLDCFHGASLELSATYKIRMRQSSYTDFVSQNCEGAYTLSSLTNIVVHSNRMAFLAGYKFSGQNNAIDGNFKGTTTTAKIKISGSKKVVFKASDDQNDEGAITADNTTVSISLKNGTIKISADGTDKYVNDDFDPKNNAVIMEQNSILLQSCDEVSIKHENAETTLKAKTSNIELKYNEISIIGANCYNHTTTAIKLFNKVTINAAGATCDGANIEL